MKVIFMSKLTPAAVGLLSSRYTSHGEEVKDIFPRVANALGKMLNGKDRTNEYLEMMNNLDFLPNSPCLYNAGYSNQLKACFTLPVEDSMDGIFGTLRNSASIFKCIASSQKMFTNSGIKTASQIKINDKLFDSNGQPQKVLDVIPTQQKDVFKLKTKCGYTIRASTEHKIKVLTGVLKHPIRPSVKSVIKFKPIGELQNDDWVMISIPEISEELYQQHNFKQEQPSTKNDGRFKTVVLKLPAVIDEDIAWLMGFFIGDGSYHNDGVTFAISSQYYPELIETIQTNLSTLGICAGVTGEKTKQVSALYKNLRYFFKAVIGEDKHQIPNIIYASPKSVKYAFLRGLFDADGTVLLDGYISICTAYTEFAEEIQALLLSVGIKTLIYHRDNGFKGQNIVQIKSKQSHKLFVNNINSTTLKKSQRMKDVTPKWVRGNYLTYQGYTFDSIKSIEKLGCEHTYNFTVENTHEYMALGIISKNSGGGVGYNFSNLREKGAPLRNGGTSSGALSFIKIYDSITEAIKQGGRRRGASMGILDYNHPEIIDFIQAKGKHNQLNNFNVSIMADNDFMKKINTDDEVALKSRLDKRKTVRTIKARDIFWLAVTYAWDNGDPGMLFYDRINKDNPYAEKINSCNPCAEQFLFPYESCCLGSINLSHCVTDDGEIDKDKLIKLVDAGSHLLLATNKLCKFPIPECYTAQSTYLRIGLGVMGFADMLMKMGILYDSGETLKTIDKIGRILGRSHKIAPQSASTLSVAPTGSLSIIANCSSGIEPIFAQNYKRHVVAGTFAESRDSEYLRTAHEITPEWHLKIQARWQKWIDNGISKTINMPHESSQSDVADIYVKAWKMGCKGVTVFRDGCRGDTGQVYRAVRGKCEGESCSL